MLVLHIGTHKTGTSALQAFLGNRARELDSSGIHYLQSGRAAGKAHHELSWAIRGKYNAQMSAWDAARTEIASSKAPIQVVSSEAFWFTDPAETKAALRDVNDVRVVMYFRRQDKYLQSLYKQTVAGGRRISFDEWREKFHFRGDYLSVVRKWADAFGRENLVIRPYERGGTTVDIVVDFLGWLGFDAVTDFKRTKAPRMNPSPRRELLELIRAFNQLDIDISRDDFFYDLVKRNSDYIRSADLLSYEECVTLFEGFAEGNRALIEEFYTDGEPLFSEIKPFPPPEIWAPESKEYFAMLIDMLDTVWMTAKFENTGGDQGNERKPSGKPKKKKDRKAIA